MNQHEITVFQITRQFVDSVRKSPPTRGRGLKLNSLGYYATHIRRRRKKC